MAKKSRKETPPKEESDPMQIGSKAWVAGLLDSMGKVLQQIFARMDNLSKLYEVESSKRKELEEKLLEVHSRTMDRMIELQLALSGRGDAAVRHAAASGVNMKYQDVPGQQELDFPEEDIEQWPPPDAGGAINSKES